MKRRYQSRRARKPQPKKTNNKTTQQFNDAFESAHSECNNGSQPPLSPPKNNYSINIKNDQSNSQQIMHRYQREKSAKSPLKRLSTNLSQNDDNKSSNDQNSKKQTKHNYNLRRTRARLKNQEANVQKEKESADDLIPFKLRNHFNKIDGKKYTKCQKEITISEETTDSTTSFLSALSSLSLCANKNEQICDELTLDDICNDEVDINEQYYDPQCTLNDDQWPSWVSKEQIERDRNKQKISSFEQNLSSKDSPSRKRRRNENNLQIFGSPPSKKSKSPRNDDMDNTNKKPMKIFSTVRKNKKRARRRSSLRTSKNMITPCVKAKKCGDIINEYGDCDTPIGSIRTQRIHRLTRKSNTDLLMDVLLRENIGACPQIDEIKKEIKSKNTRLKIATNKKLKKIGFNVLNGLSSIGKMDNLMEQLCLYLLSMGADSLWLNKDGVSAIYVAMHYENSYNVIATMIDKSIFDAYDELNQTYIFCKHGTLSLCDVALRVGDKKTVKLLLENDLMPTRHTIDYKPTVDLMSFCKKCRIGKLANRILKEQLFEAVENLDIDYIESIICHGIDVNVKMDTQKSSLYYLVQEPFDVYDELDAKDQYETIECLLKNGANPNFMDPTKTPMLIYPLQRSGSWNIKLVDILLYYGANLKLKVGDTSQNLFAYAKENCVCSQILKIITDYFNNIGKKKRNKTKEKGKQKAETVEINVVGNDTLTEVIKTKPIVKKSYKRNRKPVKR